MVGKAYFDLAGLEGAKEELLEDSTEEERADEAEVGEDLERTDMTSKACGMKRGETCQDAATTLRQIDGDRVEGAVYTTGVCYGCGDGKGGEDAVEEDPV